MELYGYTSHHYPPRSPPGPKMHSTLTFPGSSGRRGSLPVISSGFDIHASPASATSPKVPHAPLIPTGKEPKTPVANGAKINGDRASPKRQRVEQPAKPRKNVEGPDAKGMEEEVKRLLASCEAQEARIKRTKANIEDHLFPELDHVVSSLSEIDREADDVIDKLDGALTSSRPILADRISKLIATHQAKVDDLEASSSPWRELVKQKDLAMAAEQDSDTEHIPNGDGLEEDFDEDISPTVRRRRKEIGDEAALARIEGWAGEVKNYLTYEIALLRIEEANRQPGWVQQWAVWTGGSLLVVLLAKVVFDMFRGTPSAVAGT